MDEKKFQKNLKKLNSKGVAGAWAILTTILGMVHTYSHHCRRIGERGRWREEAVHFFLSFNFRLHG
jgi:hypothetical protein